MKTIVLQKMIKKHLVKSALFFAIAGLSSANAQQNYTFTTAGATGINGPTQANINTAYAATSLSNAVTVNTLGIQQWTVPTTGNYRLEAIGAKGGDETSNGIPGGSGARMEGTFSFTAGTVLKIAVGQAGGDGSDTGGGGGGSFITDITNTPLCIAGGGGGAYFGFSPSANSSGTVSNNANAGMRGDNNTIAGLGGTNGSGGFILAGVGTPQAGAGGGLTGNGADGGSPNSGGKSFINGATGGTAVSDGPNQAGDGGFGGGGAGNYGSGFGIPGEGSGGGGGYSGGGGGLLTGVGGGGGSFNSGSNQNNASGVNAGNGRVIISSCYLQIMATSTLLCSAGTITLTTNGIGDYSWNTGATSSSIAVSPTTTTVYTLSATGSGSCAAMNASITIVVSSPQTTLATTNTLICSGKSATLTSGPGAATSYSWNTGATTSSIVVSPTVNTTYTLTRMNAVGCASSAFITLTVSQSPSVTASASSPSVCSNQTVILNASGANSYTWSPNVVNNTTFTPQTTTNYTVTGEANGCTSTATISVVVVITPTLAPVMSSTAICIGSSATVTALGATTYSWLAQTFTGANSPSVVLSPTVTTTYTLFRDNNTCTSTNIFTLVVNALPIITAGPNATVCACTGSANVTATGGITYTWMPSGAQGSNIAFYPCASTIYTVTGTNNNLCSSTATVEISVSPVSTITLTASSPSICAGNSVSLNALGATAYTWASQSASMLAIGIASIAASPTVTTLFTVSGTNSFNCVSSSNVLVVVNALPVITTTVSPSLICAGSMATVSASGAANYIWGASSVTANPASTTNYTVIGFTAAGCSNTAVYSVQVSTLQLTASASNAVICNGKTTTLTASGGSNFNWVGLSLSPLVVVSPSVAMIYTVTGLTPDNCAQTKTVSVAVNAIPNLVISSTHSMLACTNDTVTLTGNGASTYTWSSNAGAATTSTVNVSSSSFGGVNYEVKGTNTNGCIGSKSISIMFDPCTGIEEKTSSASAIVIYPNPNNGNFKVKGIEGTRLSIINTLGQVVKILTITETNEVSVDELSKGIYYLMGENNGQKISSKIIIE